MIGAKTLQRNRICQGAPILLPEMEEAVLDALRNDRYIDGENVVKFEEEFAQFVGTKYAVSTNSGTTALAFILMSLDAKGKKYVTTPWSFVATANAILHAGGLPLFADISDRDYCLDPDKTESLLKTTEVSGILPVHIYGHPADFDKFQELSYRFNVPVVEDAAQAHGALYKGKQIGSLGVAAAFSFYPSKNMSVLGDGGMVTTNDEQIAKTVAKLRNSGRSSHYKHDILGFTARLNTVNAAIGRVQLRHLIEWNEKRKEAARGYTIRLKTLEQVRPPPMPDNGIQPVYHQYVIRVKERDSLKKFLEDNNIECGVHYPIPIHLQPLYERMFGFEAGNFRNSEKMAGECLSLPMHPLLLKEDVQYVCDKIEEFYGGQNRKNDFQ